MANARARRSREFSNLQVIAGFIIIGILLGAAATATIFLSAGRQVTGDAPVAAGLAQAALLAGGSLAVAALVGFLFGVPRSQGTSGGGAADKLLTYTVSNLEQVSDWLTKMLVGAGLVALANISYLTNELRTFAAIGDDSDWGERIGTTVLLYFTILGFLAGYVTSRMQFAQLLERPVFIARAVQALQRVPVTEAGAHRVGLSVDDFSAIAALARLPASQMITPAERRAWAKAQLVAGEVGTSSPDVIEALEAAEKIYARLARSQPEAQLLTEFSLVLRRLGKDPEKVDAFQKPTPASAPEGKLSPRAAIDLMFASLYEPPPEGFQRVIRIGEDLVRQVQDDSMWAYLACAYGQMYRFTQEQNRSAAELAPIRERTLFCIKQALDMNAARWRPALRALWDTNAVRPDGDDDLTVFSGDPQFAALLEPEALSQTKTLTENIAAGIGSALLAPQHLVRYSGAVELWLGTVEGGLLKLGSPLVGGQSYRLLMRLVPNGLGGAAGDGPAPDIQQTLSIVDGEDRPTADFEIRPDAPDIRFSPDRSCISASLSAATPVCDFSFQAPERVGAHEVWVEILQGRRTIKTVGVPFNVVPSPTPQVIKGDA